MVCLYKYIRLWDYRQCKIWFNKICVTTFTLFDTFIRYFSGIGLIKIRFFFFDYLKRGILTAELLHLGSFLNTCTSVTTVYYYIIIVYIISIKKSKISVFNN